jgi:hypothetical protein
MPHRSEHSMIGPGGHIRVPRSESATIDGAIALISNGQYREAIDLLRRLRSQVSSGYHRNPYKPFRVIGEMGSEVHSVAYTHSEDGKNYKHDFEGENAQLLAIERHGKKDLLITSRRGVPLWDEF